LISEAIMSRSVQDLRDGDHKAKSPVLGVTPRSA
jgi:hypothetical protein